MNFTILLLFIINHLVCDFIFQGNKILNLRFDKKIRKHLYGNILHSAVHFIGISTILLLIVSVNGNNNYSSIFEGILSIIIFHFIIDELKSLITKFYPSLRYNMCIFLMDQLLHCIVIIRFWVKVDALKSYEELKQIPTKYPQNITMENKILIIVIIFILCTWCCGVFISSYLIRINIKALKEITFAKNFIIKKTQRNYFYSKDRGFIIGILERIFILLIVASGQASLIVLVITVKSIARFKELNNRAFAEDFIIGTFISFIIAIIGGIIINTLQVIPNMI